MSGLIFDGHDLELICICGDPEITALRSSVEYADTRNRNGAIVLGRTWDTSTVTCTVEVIGSAMERRNAISTLGMWLDVSEPKKLVLPDTPDRYYLAIPDGDFQLTRGYGGELGQLTFTLVDPIAYGRTRSISVPSGGQTSFIVGGTAKAYPYIESQSVTPNSSKIYGLRLDEGEYFHIQSTSTAAFNLAADFEQRTSTVNNALTLPTLDSDWFTLSPDSDDTVHTLRNDVGSGAITVKYQERWL